MSRIALTLDLLPGELAVCRLGPDAVCRTGLRPPARCAP